MSEFNVGDTVIVICPANTLHDAAWHQRMTAYVGSQSVVSAVLPAEDDDEVTLYELELTDTLRFLEEELTLIFIPLENVSPPSPEKADIDKTLEERGSRYGPFDGHASITQRLKMVMAGSDGHGRLSYSQAEALDMIAHKIGRILNGDPNYDDSWVDIAGYAQLIVKQLRGEGV